MFKVLILACSVNLAPADCQINTALDELMCGFHGQAYIAETAIPGRGDGEYIKTKCTHSSIAKTIG